VIKRDSNLPIRLTQPIGRADIINNLAERLPQLRLLTIAGPGGIGKTTVALDVAERLLDTYQHGVWLIDLAALGDCDLVPSAVMAALGLAAHSEEPLPELISELRDKQMLLVLDNCEQVIASAAGLVSGVLKGAPNVQILATSRDPLRAEGEHLYRLPPLATPPASARVTARGALNFPAIQLFVERAAGASGEFELTDAEAPLVAAICRKLDGIPLAIELAAVRVGALGLHGVAARMEDRFRLLTVGYRTAPPRHQTLQAMLDWSYRLLSNLEQSVLRRLSTFPAASFTFGAAATVAAETGQSEREIIDIVLELVAKSLIMADVQGAEPRLRLLETTRAYAGIKLAETGERVTYYRRQAA
jgi:predicted ATPase